jgi:hypothetical protein
MCEQFLRKFSLKKMKVPIDTPPNLKDSNVNLRVKTTVEEKVGVLSLARSILGVRGGCESSKMGIKTSDK